MHSKSTTKSTTTTTTTPTTNYYNDDKYRNPKMNVYRYEASSHNRKRSSLYGFDWQHEQDQERMIPSSANNTCYSHSYKNDSGHIDNHDDDLDDNILLKDLTISPLSTTTTSTSTPSATSTTSPTTARARRSSCYGFGNVVEDQQFGCFQVLPDDSDAESCDSEDEPVYPPNRRRASVSRVGKRWRISDIEAAELMRNFEEAQSPVLKRKKNRISLGSKLSPATSKK